MPERHRFKQTEPLQERLVAFVAELRDKASLVASGPQSISQKTIREIPQPAEGNAHLGSILRGGVVGVTVAPARFTASSA